MRVHKNIIITDRNMNTSGDTVKYNLRCVRSISEKMTKEDFVYDMRRPFYNLDRKVGIQKKPIVLPIQLKKKAAYHPRISQYAVVSVQEDFGAGGDADRLLYRRVLNYKCNLCKEPIATLFSLSTHVKSHGQKYCGKCFWIPLETEDLGDHIETFHKT